MCLELSFVLCLSCTFLICVCPVSSPSGLSVPPSDLLLVPTSISSPHVVELQRYESIPSFETFSQPLIGPFPPPLRQASNHPHQITPFSPRLSTFPSQFRHLLPSPSPSHHLLRHLNLGFHILSPSPLFDDVLFGHTLSSDDVAFKDTLTTPTSPRQIRVGRPSRRVFPLATLPDTM